MPLPVPAPERKPVRAPRLVLEKVRDFVRNVTEGAANAEEAARRLLAENPDVAAYPADAVRSPQHASSHDPGNDASSLAT